MNGITKETTERNFNNYTLNNAELANAAKALLAEHKAKLEALENEYKAKLGAIVQNMEFKTKQDGQKRVVKNAVEVTTVFNNAFGIKLNDGQFARVFFN